MALARATTKSQASFLAFGANRSKVPLPGKPPIPVMSQHASLKKSSSIGAKRSVLKRFERVKLLQKRGKWKEGQSPVGLPKTTPDA